ncbi:Sporulation kinase A [compost metagenome]
MDNPGKLHIHGDSEKLLQAVLNIMSNAIRHASQAVDIEISERDGQVQIDVIDDGQGIPDQLLPQLFQRFIKGKNGETGLGLAISRAIVERCDGTISAHNGEQGGAIFRMSFPSK